MLTVKGVSKRYGSIRALSDVSLTAGVGEIVAVVGENGAGKSTLVRCVARAVAADAGTIAVDGVELGGSPRDAIASGISVVWQDLALCENLDVTANLFLGRELGGHGGLQRAAMHSRAEATFRDLNVVVPKLDRSIDRLSGGQRQLVAIARSTLDKPRVLILDEPTAALGIAESRTVLDVVRTLQSSGVAIVLVSHQLDEVFDVADRIAVLRHGRIAADVYRAETHPDDVVALITGADADSTAGKQLRRLHSLAEQLSKADEASVIPLTVSSLSGALAVDRLSISLVEDDATGSLLRRSASLHLPENLTDQLESVALGDPSVFVAEAARGPSLVVVPDLRDRHGDPLAEAATEAGFIGAWAAPIVGADGALAVVAGFTDTIAYLQPDQVRLLELFSSMAGAVIERGRLVGSLEEQNRALEGLSGVLERLAGPELLQQGMGAALDAVCDAAACEQSALLVRVDGEDWTVHSTSTGIDPGQTMGPLLRSMEEAGEASRQSYCSQFEWSRGSGALVCRWHQPPQAEPSPVIDSAAESFALALERDAKIEAEQEAAALRRSRIRERELACRLGHELRTPLTAIRGFASAILQPDVDWPDDEKQRFVALIEREARRMARLVDQMFDESALELGILRLDCNYCDLVAVLENATTLAAPHDDVHLDVHLDVPNTFTIWGDRDRLQQVFVNLIANAFRHNDEGTEVSLNLTPPSEPDSERVTVVVSDNGRGLPSDALDYLNGLVIERSRQQGLGLCVVRGLVEMHGGQIDASVSDGSRIAVTLPVERGDEP